MLRLALAGIPLPLGAAHSSRAWLSVDNLVDLLLAVADRDLHGEVIWHVRDAEQTSVAGMLRALAAAGGVPSRLMSVPQVLCMGVARVLGQQSNAMRLFAPLSVDIGQTSELLGWQPKQTQAQAIDKVVAWYRSQS